MYRLGLLLALLLVPAAIAQNATTQAAESEALVPRLIEEVSDRLPAGWTNGELEILILSLLVWAAVGGLVVLVVAPFAKWATKRTPTDLDEQIVSILSTPVFVLIFTFGVVDSLQALKHMPGWLDTTLARTWDVLFIATVTYIAHRMWHEIIRSMGAKMAKKTTTDLDDKLFPLFDKFGGIIIIFVGIWFIVDSFNVNMTLFAAGGALGGLVVAFAAQDTLANLFAGVHILLDRPFREGDRIEIQEAETWGDVVEIGLRTTRIRTRDNRMVIVPNAIIGTNPVINHSYPDSTYRIETHVGIAYGSDIEKARQAMIDAILTCDGVMKDRRVDALFMEFADSSLLFRLRWWIPSYWDTRRMTDAAHTAINKHLAEAGIEIPFPQRVLWNGAAPDRPVVPADGDG